MAEDSQRTYQRGDSVYFPIHRRSLGDTTGLGVVLANHGDTVDLWVSSLFRVRDGLSAQVTRPAAELTLSVRAMSLLPEWDAKEWIRYIKKYQGLVRKTTLPTTTAGRRKKLILEAERALDSLEEWMLQKQLPGLDEFERRYLAPRQKTWLCARQEDLQEILRFVADHPDVTVDDVSELEQTAHAVWRRLEHVALATVLAVNTELAKLLSKKDPRKDPERFNLSRNGKRNRAREADQWRVQELQWIDRLLSKLGVAPPLISPDVDGITEYVRGRIKQLQASGLPLTELSNLDLSDLALALPQLPELTRRMQSACIERAG